MLFDKKVEAMFRSRLCTRQDNPHGIFYFSPMDFPDLQTHPYSFRSDMGHELKGYFYHYENPIPGRVVVFDHGMGNGHRAYMREIERLCKGGFLVFSYDHTGCMASGGSDIRGFAQSLADLDDCMKALKAEPGLKGYSFSVMGHSWGGFSTMNIGALHPEITHVVSMSGFVSVERIVRQSLGAMKMYTPAIVRLEQRTNPRYARYNALESLQKTEAKVLLIYSADDKTVHKAVHYDPLYEALGKKAHIQFLLLEEGKDHNPSYTAEAVAYKNTFWAALSKAIKDHRLDNAEDQQAFMAQYDWWRMTEQDEIVWQRILEHLNQ